MFNPNKFSGYTGRQMEEELFSKTNPEKLEKAINGKVSFKEAMEIAKKTQTIKDPTDPDPRFANDLHATIADKIGMEDYSSLRFFSAVGSVLDAPHRVDAFFEMEENGRNVFVTLDVTIRTDKVDPSRPIVVNKNKGADIIFYMPGDGLDPKIKEDKEAYCDKIEEVSSAIVEVFGEKINNTFYKKLN